MAWLGAIRDRQGVMRLPDGVCSVRLEKLSLAWESIFYLWGIATVCGCHFVWLAVDYSSQLVLDVTLKLLSRLQSKRPMTEFIQDIIIQNLSWVIKQCFWMTGIFRGRVSSALTSPDTLISNQSLLAEFNRRFWWGHAVGVPNGRHETNAMKENPTVSTRC